MGYIQSNLLQNEKILLSLRPHWVVFSSAFWGVFFAAYIAFFAPRYVNFIVLNQWQLYSVIAIALVIVSIYWFIDAYIYYATTEYGVTTKRVMMKEGWIRRHSLEIMIEKVEGVLVDQTIFGRLLNYGLITIIGTGGTKDRFSYIVDPLRFRKMVQQQIDALEHPTKD